MATTDFGNLLTDQKVAWARDLWRQARNASFILKHAGTSATSCIQKVTALTKSEKGDAAIVTLVPEISGHGIAGDNTLEGNEEAANAYDFKIPVDQHRMGMKTAGRMAEQATIVEFRKNARDLLGYRFGTLIDKIGFNLLAGIAVDTNPDGVEPGWSAVAGANLYELAFGTEQTPTASRQFHTEALDAVVIGDGHGTTPTVIQYGHIVNLKAEAHERYIKPVVHSQYGEVYYLWVSPRIMANLKLDQDFLDNVRHAMPRSKSHDLFVGTDAVMVDGVIVMSHRYVPTNVGTTDNVATTTASNGTPGTGLAKFGPTPGTTNSIAGTRCLFLGAQALALCDLGTPYWNESSDNDYGNQPGMSIGKLYGMAKPQYLKSYDTPGSLQDFGVLTLDVAHI